MSIVRSKNDVLTVLIHLGYLAYDEDRRLCYVPNKEVADEFLNAVEDTSWSRLVDAITASRNLLVGISYDKESKQHTCRIERCRN